MGRGTCASIWDLVWIPLFVYSEAAVQVQRKASLRGGSLFWLECSRLSFNSEASLSELSVPRLFVEHFVLFFVKIKQILISKCAFRFVLRPFLKIIRILFR